MHPVMSPQALASGGGGSLQAGEAVWSLDLEDYPKEVGTLRDTGPWYPQWGPGGDSKGVSRWGAEQAEQGVLDLGSTGDTWGACLVLEEHAGLSAPLLQKGQWAWAPAGGLRSTLCATRRGVPLKKAPSVVFVTKRL